MTLEKLNKICADNNIPSDVTLSGWDCGLAEMNGVWYNPETRVIVFTQRFQELTSYNDYERTTGYGVDPNYICLYCV